MKSYIELFPQALEIRDEGQRRSCLVKQTTIDGKSTEEELWYLYPHGIALPEDDDCDAYLLSALLPAMKLNANIKVYGSASRSLLANLTELQLIWQTWCPELYFIADIKTNQLRDNDVLVPGAIVAFSGGTDAQFSAYRHATGKAGYATQELKAGVLVQGFDIPLADDIGFLGAERMATETLADIELKLLAVKTNTRELWDIHWPHYYGAAVASVLCGLNKYAGTGIMGSGPAYEALFTPCGSHPMTDPLLSSNSFKMIHDGAGFSRSQKIELLAQWPLGMKNLRVCWAGDSNDSNCGLCEKCVRTRLNFLLAGVENPGCFSSSLNEKSFESIVLHSDGSRADWGLIRDEIVRTGICKEWLPLVKKVFKRRSRPRIDLVLPVGSRRREWVKNMVLEYRK